jgi:hypothetical protein
MSVDNQWLMAESWGPLRVDPLSVTLYSVAGAWRPRQVVLGLWIRPLSGTLHRALFKLHFCTLGGVSASQIFAPTRRAASEIQEYDYEKR